MNNFVVKDFTRVSTKELETLGHKRLITLLHVGEDFLIISCIDFRHANKISSK